MNNNQKYVCEVKKKSTSLTSVSMSNESILFWKAVSIPRLKLRLQSESLSLGQSSSTTPSWNENRRE